MVTPLLLGGIMCKFSVITIFKTYIRKEKGNKNNTKRITETDQNSATFFENIILDVDVDFDTRNARFKMDANNLIAITNIELADILEYHYD